MTDIHTHLLPNVDDGVSAADEALYWLDEYASAGFSALVCTPHIGHPSVKVSGERIREAYAWFVQEAADRGLKTYLGGEYYVNSPRISSDYAFTLADDRMFQLLECHTQNPPLFLPDLVFSLSLQNIQVILAHVERYDWFQPKSRLVQRLREMEVLFQVNIGSVKTRKVRKLLKLDFVDFIATDNHGTGSSRRGKGAELRVFSQYREIMQRADQIMGL